MPQFWWVNHKQTFRQEIDGQYLWSPKTQSNGARSQFYDNMRLATPGDLVLSYANGLVSNLGRVAEFAFTSPKPEEFGETGAYWNQRRLAAAGFLDEAFSRRQAKATYQNARPIAADAILTLLIRFPGTAIRQLISPAFPIDAFATRHQLLASFDLICTYPAGAPTV